MRADIWLPMLELGAVSLAASAASPAKPGGCHQAVIEGTVRHGEPFRAVFTPGWAVLLEPLPSGWVLRVVPASGPRPPHDAAELATPPYRSVTPLLLSTDWAFRSQDALGWNPRRFHYALTADDLRNLGSLYARMEAGDAAAASALASLTARQPEGIVEILDAAMTPGSADQTQQAASVALHFLSTPHRVEQAPPSPLGSIVELHFRLRLDLPAGRNPAPGVHAVVISCPLEPTRLGMAASQ